MRKTNSADNRPLRAIDREKILEVTRKRNSAPLFDLDNPELQKLKETNPDAYIFHLGLQVLISGIENSQANMIEIAKSKMLCYAAKLTTHSTQPWFKFSKEQISNFYGVSDTALMNLNHWKESKQTDVILRVQKLNLGQFLNDVQDVISVAMAIADKRVIFLNNEFSITYGVSQVEANKLLYGELFVAVVDSRGIWSLDKDDAVRIKISTLRAARRAVANWRGASLKGEITHSEAKRIADFLGFIPLAGSNFVMLKSSKAQKGFS